MTSLSDLGYTNETADIQISNNLTLEQRMSNNEFDNFDLTDIVRLGRLVNNSKITSRWLERRIANAIGGKWNPLSEDGKDYGDILAGAGVIGEDNIELKSSEKDGRYRIGGGQCRFFENIPYYLFLQYQQGGNDYFDLYLLSKEDIWQEIFVHKVCRCSPSQVSGQTKVLSEGQMKKMSDDEVRKLVQESFDSKNNILWGFGIDSNPGEFKRKEPTKPKNMNTKAGEKFSEKHQSYLDAKAAHQQKVDTLTRWTTKYKVTIEQLKNWDNLKKVRNGF